MSGAVGVAMYSLALLACAAEQTAPPAAPREIGGEVRGRIVSCSKPVGGARIASTGSGAVSSNKHGQYVLSLDRVVNDVRVTADGLRPAQRRVEGSENLVTIWDVVLVPQAGACPPLSAPAPIPQECEDYLRTAQLLIRCDRIPAEYRARIEKAFANAREEWGEAGPDEARRLTAVCAKGIKAVEEEGRTYGCWETSPPVVYDNRCQDDPLAPGCT